MQYDRSAAVAYAHKWAFGRNPEFGNFDAVGGDCTNFISQCVYAGAGIMNYTPHIGWYYISMIERAPAWSGVPFLFQFLTGNQGPGPFAERLPIVNAQIGDVIQLSFDGLVYAHSLCVVQTGRVPNVNNILIAAHTSNSDYRPLSSYSYRELRLLHILGVRE